MPAERLPTKAGRRRRRRRQLQAFARKPVVRIAAVVVLVGLVALAVRFRGVISFGDDSAGPAVRESTATSTTRPPEARDFSGRGPYVVGEIDLALDADHPVTVFYPVDERFMSDDRTPYRYSAADAFGEELAATLPGAVAGDHEVADTWVEQPASIDAPFPVVLASHDTGGSRLLQADLHAHLASWGYVVVAVQDPGRDARAVAAGLDPPVDDGGVDRLFAALDLVTDPNGLTSGIADAGRVVTLGLGSGGRTAGVAASDDRVAGWIGLAPDAPVPADAVPAGTPGFDAVDVAAFTAANEPPPVPSLTVTATGDTVTTADEVRTLVDWYADPRRLVVLADAGHDVAGDLCAVIQEAGGSAALGADPATVPALRGDGCDPDDRAADDTRALLAHLLVSQLRELFGPDPDGAALSLEPAFLDATFPGFVDTAVVVGARDD